MKERIRKEYLSRVEAVWSSQLPMEAKVRIHNSWVVSAVRYFCAPVSWSEGNLEELDRATRAVMVRCTAHEKRASIERLYLPRESGSRGLLCIEHVWEREKVAMALYMRKSEDRQVQGALKCMRRLETLGEETQVTVAWKILHEYQVGVL